MLPRSTLPAVCRLSISLILAAWCCVWILKPTRFWKMTWHQAEDWADATFLRASGLNVVVFCFPLLLVAVTGYVYLYLCARERRFRKRAPLATYLSNPVIVSSPVGVLSSLEVIAVALFVGFLLWTYYSNVSSDLRKLIPSKSLKLNRWQLRVMAAGVRFGSLTEACLALLLLPVLRGMSVFNICGVQFEASVRYHVWLGNAVMLFSVLHSSIIMFVWGSKNSLLMEITRWQRTGRVYLAGAIALAAGLVIWLTSLPPIRRKNFQFFYFSHHLYVLFFVFFLLHAGAGHFYLVLSGVLLFAIDKLLRILQSRRATCLVSARVLPCNAIELTIPKDQSMQYTPTSTLFVKVPNISKFQWHPFSITSSSNMEDDRLSLMVKCQGPWTSSLYDLIQSIKDDTKNLLVAVEGPYGPVNFPCRRYDSLVLIAGGSGITPFLSILQDVASGNGRTSNYPKKIELIYAVKKSQDLCMLTPISTLLLNQSDDLVQVKLRLFVTQEEEGTYTTVGEALHEMSQVKTVILDQSYSRDSIGKPEGHLSKATITGLASLVFLVSLVSLTHVFIHQGKRSSQNTTPSWISDVLIVCCLIIATSFSIPVIMLLCKWWTSLKDYRVPPIAHKNARSSHLNFEMKQDFLGKNEISYGKRPNLTDILLEQSTESGESNDVGVFVCGPDSLQETVASFCRKYSRMCGKKNKCFYSFHSINFSL